ncbi:MAG: glucosamine-6-phosphate deaminase [Mobilitalea sp.]
MRIYETMDYHDMSRKAANIISAQVIANPSSVLGLATGSSPIGTYQQLVEWYKKGDLDFSEVRTVNLDEYKGLSSENENSYRYFMKKNLFDQINISAASAYFPNGLAKNDEEECARYDEVIQSLGGIDLQLLGIGHNGHIGFNEPGASFEKSTHVVALTESTIQANSRLFKSPEQVPTHAYTMGIKSIMQSQKILLIVSGSDKAEIIRDAFTGPITPSLPASILQLHNDVTLVGDKASLALLTLEGR